MDRFSSMRVFQHVIDEGGFASAARSLDMSPAGVTRMVAALEEHLGVRLLQRTTRKLALTDAGEAYLQRVRSILHEVEDAESAAAEHTRELQGTLHVLATPVLASYFLSPRIATWHARHPGVLLDLQIDPFPQPRIEEFDVTFLVVDEGFDGDIVARPLATTDWIACASPDYLLRAGTPDAPEQLRGHTYLKFQWPQNSGHYGRQTRLQPVGGGDAVEVDLRPALQTTSFDVLLRAALDGAGITFLSRLLVASHLERGSLVHLLPDWVFGRFTIYAALPTRKFMPSRTRAFLDFLAEFGPRDGPGRARSE
ncbi:LysR family transcriptional regulator [Polaromonas sp.]|jgi:DNA-binding transcriptional LysR family regulator|uniref:LysR family transcriptional regulator n=1 Tax=Polaromonas sp. TaxID=1869339 RepID=UPI0037C9793C